jgi:hypothetical protein
VDLDLFDGHECDPVDDHDHPDGARCDHPTRALHRHEWASGGGYHVHMHCDTCGAMLPKPGSWISQMAMRQLGLDPTKLPQWTGGVQG